jgi:hypothetical protein
VEKNVRLFDHFDAWTALSSCTTATLFCLCRAMIPVRAFVQKKKEQKSFCLVFLVQKTR